MKLILHPDLFKGVSSPTKGTLSLVCAQSNHMDSDMVDREEGTVILDQNLGHFLVMSWRIQDSICLGLRHIA